MGLWSQTSTVENNTSISALAGENISYPVGGKNGQCASAICVLLLIKRKLIVPFLKQTMYTSSSSKLVLSVISRIRIEKLSKLSNSVPFQHSSACINSQSKKVMN